MLQQLFENRFSTFTDIQLSSLEVTFEVTACDIEKHEGGLRGHVWLFFCLFVCLFVLGRYDVDLGRKELRVKKIYR